MRLTMDALYQLSYIGLVSERITDISLKINPLIHIVLLCNLHNVLVMLSCCLKVRNAPEVFCTTRAPRQ